MPTKHDFINAYKRGLFSSDSCPTWERGGIRVQLPFYSATHVFAVATYGEWPNLKTGFCYCKWKTTSRWEGSYKYFQIKSLRMSLSDFVE